MGVPLTASGTTHHQQVFSIGRSNWDKRHTFFHWAWDFAFLPPKNLRQVEPAGETELQKVAKSGRSLCPDDVKLSSSCRNIVTNRHNQKKGPHHSNFPSLRSFFFWRRSRLFSQTMQATVVGKTEKLMQSQKCTWFCNPLCLHRHETLRFLPNISGWLSKRKNYT